VKLWTVRIEQAEIERELGKADRALDVLAVIRSEALREKDWHVVASATGHILVCYKHLYQNTRNESYLSAMAAEVNWALELPIPEMDKAVLWLRKSDVAFALGNLTDAEALRVQACEMVEKNSLSEAEYLGHLAEVKAMCGKLMEAEYLFGCAATILEGTRRHRSFNQVSLECGMFARRAKLAALQKRYWCASRYFLRGYHLALIYKYRYGMGQRLRQYHDALLSIIDLYSGHLTQAAGADISSVLNSQAMPHPEPSSKSDSQTAQVIIDRLRTVFSRKWPRRFGQ